jgi:hypothetical protein
MELTGVIEKINLNAGKEGFAKSELVLKIETPHSTEYVNIEFGGTRADLSEPYKERIGETVTVAINIGGRPWTNPQGETLYFNSIRGWKITPPQQK